MIILHVLRSNRLGGAERLVINLIKKMSDLETNNRYIYVSPSGPIDNILKNNGVEFISLRNNLSVKELQLVINEIKPDIIHLHDFSAATIGAMCLFSGIRIAHIHHNPEWTHRWSVKSLLFTLLSGRLTKIIFVSKSALLDTVFANLIRRKSQVISNGVDFQSIEHLSSEFSVGSIDVLFVGRLEKEKDPTKFINIITKLRKTNINVKATIVGTGSLTPVCQSEIKKNNLENNISMVGFAENPYPFMKAAKVCLSTSNRDAFGLVAVEASYLKCQVLVNDIPGISETAKFVGGRTYESDDDCVDFLRKILNQGNSEYSAKESNFDSLSIEHEANAILRIYNQYRVLMG